MSSYAHLRDRGYFDPRCRCSVVLEARLNTIDRYEVKWTPGCSIHKDDVTGIEYERRNK